MEAFSYAVLAALVGLAFVFGALARRVGVSAAVGYLFAGLVIGFFVSVPGELVTALGVISEVSIALLFFEIGYEVHVRNIHQLRGAPLYVSILEMTLATSMALALGLVAGLGLATSLVFGLAAAFSSTVFTYKLLEESPPTRGDVRVLVLMVAAVEDIVIVAVLTLLAAEGLGPVELAELAAVAAAVTFVIFWAGEAVVPRVLEPGEGGLVLLISYGLIAAFAASVAGLSPSIGAFVAGLAVSKAPRAEEVMERFRPVRAVFIVLFLIFMGIETAAATPEVIKVPAALVVGVLLVPIHTLATVVATPLVGGLGLKYGLEAGIYLSTLSELSLVIAYVATAEGVAPAYVLPATAIGVAIASVTASAMASRKYGIVVESLRLIPRRVRWAIDSLSLAIQRQAESHVHSAAYRILHTVTHSASEVVIATAIVLEALKYLPSAFPAHKALVLAAVIGAYLATAARLVGRAVKASGELADTLGAPKGLKKVAEVSVAAIIAGISAEVAAIILVFRYGEELSGVLGLDYSVLAPTILVLPLAVMLTAIAIAAEVIKT